MVVLEPESPLVEDFLQCVVGSVLMDSVEVTLFLDREDMRRVIMRCVDLLLSVYVRPYVVSSFSGTKVTWLGEEDLRKVVNDVVNEILDEWYSNEFVSALRSVIRVFRAWGGGGEGVQE